MILVGGHRLLVIEWDVSASFQCELCHRVFEAPSDAEENPCDVVEEIEYPSFAEALAAFHHADLLDREQDRADDHVDRSRP